MWDSFTVWNGQLGDNGIGTEMLSTAINLGVIHQTILPQLSALAPHAGNGSATPPLNILKSEVGRDAWTYLLQLRHQLLPDPLLQFLAFLTPHKSRCRLDLTFAHVLPVHLFACNSTVD